MPSSYQVIPVVDSPNPSNRYYSILDIREPLDRAPSFDLMDTLWARDFSFRLVRSRSGRNMLGWSYEVHPEGSRSADQGTYSATPAFERVDDSV